MTTLPIKTLVGNAAAVLCGIYGTVTGQAKLQRCSRQTVYTRPGANLRFSDEPNGLFPGEGSKNKP